MWFVGCVWRGVAPAVTNDMNGPPVLLEVSAIKTHEVGTAKVKQLFCSCLQYFYFDEDVAKRSSTDTFMYRTLTKILSFNDLSNKFLIIAYPLRYSTIKLNYGFLFVSKSFRAYLGDPL